MQLYSDPSRENDPHALPDVEVFELSHAEAEELAQEELDPGTYWAWWSCFPGCLPDGEACGPFASREAAEADARIDRA